jgi:hypothetical protein
LRDPDTRLPNGPLPLLFNFSQYGLFDILNKFSLFKNRFYLELTINLSLNSRLIPPHMQGQQTVAASSGASSNSAVNASATGTGGNGNTAGTSATTPSTNDKPLTSTNQSSNTPPSSVVPAAASTIVNEPSESDAMNSLDEQTATGGDSINKDRS